MLDTQNDEKPPLATTPTTYVLAGDDPTDAFKTTVEHYKQQKNVVVLTASDFPSLDDAIKHIKPPANIVIACHGQVNENDVPTGTIRWNKGEHRGPYYDELFEKITAAAPKDVGAISVLSCNGEIAFEDLSSIPHGTVLQVIAGAKASSNTYFNNAFQEETSKTNDPATLAIEMLDNVDPVNYQKLLAIRQELGTKTPELDKPENLLPLIIGIGGNPPVVINLDETSEKLVQSSHTHPHEYKQAIKLVQAHFDTDKDIVRLEVLKQDFGANLKDFDGHVSEQKKGELTELIVAKLKEKFPGDADKIDASSAGKYFDKLVSMRERDAQHVLEQKITAVAEKIKHGEPIALDKDGHPDFDELRIRRALGVAYLKTSGELDKLVEQAKTSHA